MKTLGVVILIVISAVVVTITGQMHSADICTTPVNTPGTCVPLRNCTSLLSIILKGSAALGDNERSYLRNSQCGIRDNHPLVCCPPIKKLLPEPGVCGIYSESRLLIPKLFIGDYPWLALLEYSKRNITQGFHCIGVLINKRYVLTAAHCVTGKSLPINGNLTGVRLGEHDLLTDPDCNEASECSPRVIDVPISERIVHELYEAESTNQANDIALLRLQFDISYTDFIRPVCLPSQELSAIDHSYVSAVGWNRDTSGYSAKLEGDVRIVDELRCSAVFNTANMIKKDSQLCGTIGSIYDTCRGISGSPIMAKHRDRNSRWPLPYTYLVGVTSFNLSHCDQIERIDVYTKIGPFIEWIESNVQP